MTTIQLTLMTVDEARTTVDQIKSNLESVRALLFELREREGWRALGYATWQACIQAEFNMSDRHAHRLLNAHRVDQILAPPWQESTAFFGSKAEQSEGPIGQPETVARIEESHARELAPLIEQPETLRAVHAEVQERTEGKPTAADYRDAVDRRLGRVHLNSPTTLAPSVATPIQEPTPSLEEIADERDHDGAVALARLNAQYSSGIAAAVKLTFLDARAVVGLLGRDRRSIHGENARMLRRWLDDVEQELQAAEVQPLRMVGGARA